MNVESEFYVFRLAFQMLEHTQIAQICICVLARANLLHLRRLACKFWTELIVSIWRLVTWDFRYISCLVGWKCADK